MIKRDLYQEIREHLSAKEMTIIAGPRQAGKTTILRQLQAEVSKSGRPTLWFNLDYTSDWRYFASQSELLKKIRLEVGDKPAVIFIDEIQRKENAGLFLKGIYDMELPYKFVISGSGSLELKEHIAESMAGRKRLFYLSTVSISEFIHFRTNYRYEDKLADLAVTEPAAVQDMIEEYLAFGGYPRVVTATDNTEKQRLIEEIYGSYLEKDITSLLRIEKTEAFDHLVKIVAAQPGRLLNMTDLSSTLGLAKATVKQYLRFMEKTFIVFQATPFHRRIRKEIVKAPIYYWYDLGLANYTADQFALPLPQNIVGWSVQSLVALLLQDILKHRTSHLHYWRTTTGAEVDFVITRGLDPYPIEVKAGALTEPRVARSLASFIEAYKPPVALVINRSLNATVRHGTTVVHFVPLAMLVSPDAIVDKLGWNEQNQGFTEAGA